MDETEKNGEVVCVTASLAEGRGKYNTTSSLAVLRAREVTRGIGQLVQVLRADDWSLGSETDEDELVEIAPASCGELNHDVGEGGADGDGWPLESDRAGRHEVDETSFEGPVPGCHESGRPAPLWKARSGRGGVEQGDSPRQHPARRHIGLERAPGRPNRPGEVEVDPVRTESKKDRASSFKIGREAEHGTGPVGLLEMSAGGPEPGSPGW